MVQATLVAAGIGGRVELVGDMVHITRSGVSGFVLHGLKGAKVIPVRRITALQFRRAGLLVNGYLQLTLEGGLEAGGGILQATKDENSIVFTRKEAAAFEALHAELMQRIAS